MSLLDALVNFYNNRTPGVTGQVTKGIKRLVEGPLADYEKLQNWCGTDEVAKNAIILFVDGEPRLMISSYLVRQLLYINTRANLGMLRKRHILNERRIEIKGYHDYEDILLIPPRIKRRHEMEKSFRHSSLRDVE